MADADVLVHNVAPPEMDRIGLNFDRLQRVQPRPHHDLDRSLRPEWT